MFTLGQLYIPAQLVLSPVTKTISFKVPETYSKGYFVKVEYSLEIKILGSDVEINYYGEDDTYLSEVLGLDECFIGSGSLKRESFGAIQERTLKVLQEFMKHPKKELLDLFNELEEFSV